MPDVACDLAAEIDAAAEGQDQGRQLENAVGDDARKIRQQGDAVVDVHPGKQPQQQGVDADGQGREIDKGDKAIGDAEHRRPDVVAEQRQHIHPAGGVHDAQLRHLLGEQAARQGGLLRSWSARSGSSRLTAKPSRISAPKAMAVMRRE